MAYTIFDAVYDLTQGSPEDKEKTAWNAYWNADENTRDDNYFENNFDIALNSFEDMNDMSNSNESNKENDTKFLKEAEGFKQWLLDSGNNLLTDELKKPENQYQYLTPNELFGRHGQKPNFNPEEISPDVIPHKDRTLFDTPAMHSRDPYVSADIQNKLLSNAFSKFVEDNTHIPNSNNFYNYGNDHADFRWADIANEAIEDQTNQYKDILSNLYGIYKSGKRRLQ